MISITLYVWQYRHYTLPKIPLKFQLGCSLVGFLPSLFTTKTFCWSINEIIDNQEQKTNRISTISIYRSPHVSLKIRLLRYVISIKSPQIAPNLPQNEQLKRIPNLPPLPPSTSNLKVLESGELLFYFALFLSILFGIYLTLKFNPLVPGVR